MFWTIRGPGDISRPAVCLAGAGDEEDGGARGRCENQRDS